MPKQTQLDAMAQANLVRVDIADKPEEPVVPGSSSAASIASSSLSVTSSSAAAAGAKKSGADGSVSLAFIFYLAGCLWANILFSRYYITGSELRLWELKLNASF